MGSGFETELKFQVAPGRRAALLRALHGGAGVERVRMAARYFDTADDRLAAAGLALRLRREGRSRWVQTLKGRGDGLMQRLEHEVVLGPREPATLDLARHDGTPAGEQLRAVLAGQRPVERFATDIVRLRRRLRTAGPAGRAEVELAFDEGHVRAGAARQAVCELEFELMAGAPAALLALAGRWVARHGLWLDVRSKAEVGHRLARAAAPAAPQATPPIVAARMGPRRALAALLQSCLAHALPNLAELAGPVDAAPADRVEAVHQLRVALRRLRTALREFGAGVAGVDPAWDGALAELFRGLGAQRDLDVVAAALAPARAAAHAAGLGDPTPRSTRSATSAGARSDPAPALQAAALQGLLLALIGFVLGAGEADDANAPAPPLLARARERLKRLHRQVSAHAGRFDTLRDEERHRLRKRAKRLRYTLEFCAPLFGRKACARYLDPLREVQQQLGELNDLALAEAWLAAQAGSEAAVAYQRGWVAARRDALIAEGARALRRLARAPRPWK